jgi:hypothetical protein
MNLKLYQVADEFIAIANKLEESDAPADAIADTLEGCLMPVEEKAKAVAAYVRNIEAEADAIERHAKDVADKAKAVRNRANAMRDYLRFNMARCGITEIKSNDGLLTIKLHRDRDSSVEIMAANDVPSAYLREIPAKLEPDKTLIKKAINDGFDVPGARIVKKDRLEIK